MINQWKVFIGPLIQTKNTGLFVGDSSPLVDEAKWSDLLDVDAGRPRAWINFEKPFAELPPIFYPPEPEQVSC